MTPNIFCVLRSVTWPHEHALPPPACERHREHATRAAELWRRAHGMLAVSLGDEHPMLAQLDEWVRMATEPDKKKQVLEVRKAT